MHTQTSTLNSADLMAQFPEKFPEYIEPLVINFPEYSDFLLNMSSLEVPTSPTINKLVKDVVAAPDRHPSPQPAHFSVPYKNGNGNGHRVLRSATVGYIAPEFKGKKAQMLQGESYSFT
jgi:glutamate dehydrogenase